MPIPLLAALATPWGAAAGGAALGLLWTAIEDALTRGRTPTAEDREKIAKAKQAFVDEQVKQGVPRAQAERLAEAHAANMLLEMSSGNDIGFKDYLTSAALGAVTGGAGGLAVKGIGKAASAIGSRLASRSAATAAESAAQGATKAAQGAAGTIDEAAELAAYRAQQIPGGVRRTRLANADDIVIGSADDAAAASVDEAAELAAYRAQQIPGGVRRTRLANTDDIVIESADDAAAASQRQVTSFLDNSAPGAAPKPPAAPSGGSSGTAPKRRGKASARAADETAPPPQQQSGSAASQAQQAGQADDSAAASIMAPRQQAIADLDAMVAARRAELKRKLAAGEPFTEKEVAELIMLGL